MHLGTAGALGEVCCRPATMGFLNENSASGQDQRLPAAVFAVR